LFDEPLSNLDAKMRVQMRVEISRLHQKLGATMIYVTHDQVEAMTMGDRIVVMEKGHIQQVAGPLDLYDKPVNRFVAGFIGTPPMNFMNGKIVKDNRGLGFVTEGTELALPSDWAERLASSAGKVVTFGIRPEDIGSSTAEKAEEAVNLRALVDVTEPMGSETYVYVKAAGASLVCRVDAHKIFKSGATVELPVDIRRCHVFAENGDVLV
jgi:multiple sugar transport system ATP-binding protein